MAGGALCGQCGKAAGTKRGRCRSCGAAIGFGEVVASDRRGELLDEIGYVFGTEWYWWIGEILAVSAVVFVVAGAAPLWVLGAAAVLLLRPASRLLMLIARGLLDA